MSFFYTQTQDSNRYQVCKDNYSFFYSTVRYEKYAELFKTESDGNREPQPLSLNRAGAPCACQYIQIQDVVLFIAGGLFGHEPRCKAICLFRTDLFYNVAVLYKANTAQRIDSRLEESQSRLF